MSKVREVFLTGKVAHPIGRTLLTTGLVADGMESLASGQKHFQTPLRAIRCHAWRQSEFWQS